VRNRFGRIRPWLAPIAVVAAAVVLLPPVGASARHYVFAQAAQFAVLAVVVPALVVLGAPWRLRVTRRAPLSRPAAGAAAAGSDPSPGRADRFAMIRSHRQGTLRAWLVLVVFIAVALAWRLPAVVNATVRHPALTAAQAVCLIAAGCALWLELVPSPPLLPRTTRPQRAAFAALPMWAIWASAYVMGFSRTAWFSALARPPGHGLGIVADQQIAAFLLFAISGLAFVPVVYGSLLTWLRDSADPDDELREVSSPGRPAMPRPPRGWRPPSGREADRGARRGA